MTTPEFIKNKWVQTSAISALTFVGGIGIGYILGKRQGAITVVPPESTNKQLSIFDVTQEELEVMTGSDQSVEIIVSEEVITEDEFHRRALHARLVKEAEESENSGELVAVNVFHNPDTDWDWEAEKSTRTGDAPYILHQEEFLEDEMGFAQSTVTYYEGDDILADERDTVIYGHSSLLGELKFGHGSKDPTIVYIRNERQRQEWEVLLHKGHYAVEALGLTMERELEHSQKHSVHKFRQGD